MSAADDKTTSLVMYDPLAELYERQYTHYREDISFYRNLADDYGSPILELGAGTARVTRALAAAGHHITAVEPSSNMIALGKAKLEADKLTQNVTYLQADARNLQLEQRFPLIIAPFNMLMHLYTLDDQDAALKVIREHLEPGGRFACDLYMPNFAALDVMRREPYWGDVGLSEDGVRSELFVLQHHNLDAQLIESRYYLDTTQPDGSLSRQVYSLSQRYYHHFELVRALTTAGFTNMSFYGDFDKSRFSSTSPYMIAVAY
ncbi:MAG: class I SAM-dependent methyltransferase [Deinococcota bacterium]